MCEVTIRITKEQERFLKEFTSKHYEGSKDNVCTRQPLHMVQTKRERIVNPDYDDFDKVVYYVSEWGESYNSVQEIIEIYYKEHQCPIEIVSFEDAYKADSIIDINGEETIISDKDDYLNAYGISSDSYDEVHIGYFYENVAAFFILDEAKKYIQYQKHNLTEPRTYTISAGYGNEGEYNHFWQLLFDIGKKLNNR